MEAEWKSPRLWEPLLVTVLLLLLTAVGLIVFQQRSVANTRDYVYETLQRSTGEQSRLFGTMVDDRLMKLTILADWIAQDDESVKVSSQRFLQILQDDGGYYRAWFMEPDGTAVSNDDRRIDISDLACYRSAMAGEDGVDIVRSKLDGDPLCVIWAPIVRDADVVGALFVTLDEETFRSMLLCEAFGDLSFSYICDPSGEVIIGAEKSQGVQSGENILTLFSRSTFQRGDRDRIADDIRTGGSGEFLLERDGVSRLAVYQPLGVNDWTIVSVVDGSVIDGPIDELMGEVYLLIGVILLAAIGFLVMVVVLIRRQSRRLVYDAEHDRLTGLLNRDAFVRKAEQMFDAAEPDFLVLCSVDIENFKVVNEQFGNEEGDRLIRRIGRYLEDDAQGAGGIACHDYADKFLVLRPEDHESFEESARRGTEILQSYDLPFHTVLRTGFYVIRESDIGVEAMIDRALLAQRSVKGLADRHVAFYDDSLRMKLLHDQAIVGGMERALAEEQFEVYLQPQYDQTTGSIVSAEALVRWNHPEWGLVPPDGFIPIFERNGFITRLDAWVWEEVCRRMALWQERNHACIPVSVNVSRAEMGDAGLVDQLCELTERYHLDNRLLRLEVTESAYADASRELLDLVAELKRRGFFLEMDDFGKGYSSLNSLKDIPVDMLKLDMRFLSSTDFRGRCNTIIVAIMRMAAELGMQVIAEGVETREQADYLLSVGCTLAQGYLFARPMPIAEFEALLRRQQEE